ncbi:hypothetical protein M0D21_04265 [Aquimarina sp. D1M17]|uniref:DUF6588 family protein n=1 Tax=Aquimarina acroporae TaxID=2937283 RepID=UPI0020BF38E7|nr:DUF6588 family protein [Aquimarina acroporae]MCK8520763.1 hypothetical protein [Aquimarina acroporae]
MKHVIWLLLFGVFSPGFSQDNLRSFLLVGIEFTERVASKYTEPMTEGIVYGLTGGWYNSAKVLEPWDIRVSIVSNGSFVPSEKETFLIDIRDIPNLNIAQNDSGIAQIPTILGGDTELQFIATRDGEQFEFTAPEGIGLIDLNLLPNAFLQLKIGLPKSTELGVRYFPKLNIDDIGLEIWGLGIQHQISDWIPPLQDSKIAISGAVAYTTLLGEYNFVTDGFVTGNNQKIDAKLDSWLFELIGSTKNPVFNIYGGLGYVLGKSSVQLEGTYVIETNTETLSFTDPFEVRNTVEGLRANIGASVTVKWFGINLDYTVQGFNNLSLGLNFKIK